MKLYSIILTFMLAYSIWVFTIATKNFNYNSNQATLKPSIENLNLKPSEFVYSYSDREKLFVANGLVDIEQLHSSIKVDLVYTTANNFTGEKLYVDFKRGFVQKPIANKLVNAQQYLEEVDSTYQLVVLDAARPKSVQQKMWEWAIINGKQKYVAAPSLGSVHNFGCAVDVTIMGKDSLLDMGTNYDHFGREAEPRYNWKLYQEGVLTKEQISNRALLREVMRKAGFRAIDSEWWHFNGLSKESARRYYKMVE